MLIVAWYCIISGLMGDRLFQSMFVVCSAMLLNGCVRRTRNAAITAETPRPRKNAYSNKKRHTGIDNQCSCSTKRIYGMNTPTRRKTICEKPR